MSSARQPSSKRSSTYPTLLRINRNSPRANTDQTHPSPTAQRRKLVRDPLSLPNLHNSDIQLAVPNHNMIYTARLHFKSTTNTPARLNPTIPEPATPTPRPSSSQLRPTTKSPPRCTATLTACMNGHRQKRLPHQPLVGGLAPEPSEPSTYMHDSVAGDADRAEWFTGLHG